MARDDCRGVGSNRLKEVAQTRRMGIRRYMTRKITCVEKEGTRETR